MTEERATYEVDGGSERKPWIVDGQPAAGAVSFEVGMPPSVNHQYVRARRGVRLSDAARRYLIDTAWSVKALGEAVPAEGRLCLLVRIEGEFKGDGDNRLKLLADAVAMGLDIDDRRFRRHTVECAGGEASPRCWVTVWW